MRNLKILFVSLFFLSQSALCEVEKNDGEDSLVDISKKISEIEQRLNDNRMFISNAIFRWRQIDHFREQLLFTVAHDPFSASKKDIPLELNPTYLTQQLKNTWQELELSVLELGELSKDVEWNSLKELVNF
jgi:hypothetical protein